VFDHLFAGDSYMLYTYMNYEFDHFVMTTDQQLLTFTVDGCSNVYIFLSHLPGVVESHSYQVKIGVQDNLRSEIVKSPPNAASQSFSTTGVLTCSEQSMWLSWLNAQIRFGKGSTVGQDVLFEWSDPQPYSINAFSLASRDNKEVMWTFPRDYCEYILCKQFS